jgi:PAS domain S-box-containing protein
MHDGPARRSLEDALSLGKGFFEGEYVSVTGRRSMFIRTHHRVFSNETGEPLGAVSLFEDITDIKQAEAMRRESEERHRLLFENSLDAVLLTSPDGAILDANPAACRMLGYDLEGLRQAGRGQVVDQSDPRLARALELRAQQGYVKAELTMIRRDGVRLPVELTSSTYSDRHGRLLTSMVARDLTERKLAEEEKAALEGQLRHAQKMQAVGTLAGGIAHEFNNLLAAILGFSELARDLGRRRQDNSGEIDQVIHAADRASALVRQMLTFSRKAGADNKPMQLNNSVIHAAKMLERTLPRSIEIETHLAPDLPLMQGDSAQIEQVLINLATNARDAMPQGGHLRISTELVVMPETVCSICGGRFSGEHILLLVRDNGQGMDQRTMEQMYEPFFTTKGVGMGTGLGLSVVLGLVQDNGGHINCLSAPGVGTSFNIYLPVMGNGVGEGQVDEPFPALEPGGSETLLLVDDEESLRSLCSRYLGMVGYQVIQAQSGEQALEIYRDKGQEIALVILDLGMPGMGGHRCLREILSLHPRAKVVIASGYTADAQAHDALEAGASAFVAKPYKRSDLLATIRGTLDGK